MSCASSHPAAGPEADGGAPAFTERRAGASGAVMSRPAIMSPPASADASTMFDPTPWPLLYVDR
jgi:hypothetical protein